MTASMNCVCYTTYSADYLFVEAPATFAFSIAECIRCNNSFFATVTTAKILHLVVLVVFRSLQHSPTPKPLTCQVNKISHKITSQIIAPVVKNPTFVPWSA